MTGKIYRGIRLNDLPEELKAIIKNGLSLPMDESEVGKHFSIGPALLDHIENSHWEQGREDFAGYDTANLGRNWTLDRSWAEKAGSPNTGRCALGVLLEADMPTNPYAFDPTNNTEDMRNVESEKQVTPIPGAPLNVTGVKIRDGQEWREVLNDPEYVARRSKEYPSILQHHTGPQIRLAMTSAEDYAMERWREGSQYFFAYTPTTYTYRGPKSRPSAPRPVGYESDSDFNFTGSPETQYHHRSITPETLKGIDKREDSVDDYYAEMAQRRDSGLEPIPWNEWLNRIGYIRTAMAWEDWKDKVKGGCQLDGCYWDGTEGRYVIPQAGAFLNYSHGTHMGQPALNVVGIYTHPDNRHDGVAEALMRKLVEDHPGIPVNPGYMTPDGQKFHDQMLEKEPEARGLITAMAWDEWAERIKQLGPLPGHSGDLGIYYINHAADTDDDDEDDSQLAFTVLPDSVNIHGVYTNDKFRDQGIAEALFRRLHQDYPNHKINPGGMTSEGRGFHDRMLEKEPDARELLANSLLVGPEDAYDEWDWFRRHQEHPPSSVNTDAETWYHVSPHHIPVGTTLAPMRGNTPWNDEPYDHGLQNRAGWIWVEFDKDKARAWMRHILKHQPEAWIYRVKPDVGPFAWNGTADEGWVTNRAIVLEELDQISRDLTFQEQP